METSLKTGFAQIFSCCPKNLSCPTFGGAAAPLAPPARTPMTLSPSCHSVQIEMYSLWISRIQMLNTLSVSSPANLNLFFRFGLFENLSDGGTTSRTDK